MRPFLCAGSALVIFWSCASPAAGAEWQAKAVFLTDARIAALQDRVAKQQEPTWSAWRSSSPRGWDCTRPSSW